MWLNRMSWSGEFAHTYVEGVAQRIPQTTIYINVKKMGLRAQKSLACEDHFTGSESGYAGSGWNPNLISFLIQRAALRCTLKAS